MMQSTGHIPIIVRLFSCFNPVDCMMIAALSVSEKS